MAIGTGHRSNNYSESKRNDHLDNNRRQEQRNKGIPNKSHPNFREEHKSFSSIFVSNIPWNASVQDLWLVSNLRTAWMGGFHLFADVAKYGRTYNRPVERSGDGKPSVGSNSQSVSINENVFQSFNSYAKAGHWATNSVDMWANTRFIEVEWSVGKRVFTDMVSDETNVLWRIAWKRNLEDAAGEILGVPFSGDCGNCTTVIIEDVTPVMLLKNDSIIAPPSTTPRS
ncbi:hypothetical protein Tco_0476073 [Tanacetum coccineum]